MARNDQVTRQWLLLKRLEATRGATLQELAEGLSKDFACHPRTIRRDLEALEMCFPLIAERVDGHTRWRLLGGCRSVRALAFSPTELMALLFTHELSKPLEGTVIEASLDSALSKAAAALPPEGMHYVKQMQGFFKSLSLCGDLASDPRYTKRLIAAGVRVVSASPRNIASVRQAVRGSYS